MMNHRFDFPFILDSYKMRHFDPIYRFKCKCGRRFVTSDKTAKLCEKCNEPILRKQALVNRFKKH